MVNVLAVSQNYNLSPSQTLNSWSKFARDLGSAATMLSHIPLSNFIEIKDNKWGGESLIVLRRTDFDKLNMLSSMASRATRYLMQIDLMTTTLASSANPNEVIKLVHEQAKLGIEFAVTPTTTSANDYFSSYSVDTDGNEDDDKIIMPKSREDIEK